MKARSPWIAALALAVLVVTCRPIVADTPAENDAQFFRMLAYKEVATLQDAYRAVAMIVRGDNQVKPADECRTLLVERGVARAGWGNDPKTPCTKGKLAYMICQALGIKGGLTMRIFGPSERYCLFECRDLELMVAGATYQNCSGGELVSTLDRAESYRVEQQQKNEQSADDQDDANK